MHISSAPVGQVKEEGIDGD